MVYLIQGRMGSGIVNREVVGRWHVVIMTPFAFHLKAEIPAIYRVECVWRQDGNRELVMSHCG